MESMQWPAVGSDRTRIAESPAAGGSDGSRRAARQLWGAALAPGFAGGRVRIVDSEAAAARLGPEDVAVCRHLTLGMAASFSRAAAVVAEHGAALEDVAEVLHDRGVPAVVAPGATSHLPPSQLVVVDGARGTVWIGARLARVGDAVK